MSNNNNIKTLAGVFKDHLELKAYCDAQYKALEAATKKIGALEDEIRHLQDMINVAVPIIQATPPVEAPVVKLNVPIEQAICEMQINKLQQTAMMRDLTLEETKRLDLLIKNLYLAKEQSNALLADFTKLPQDLSEEALLELMTPDGSSE